ncbi:MAG: hypothetical protein QOG79_7217 [Mycobacterium sp.]|nr:hypothetical protein [Mycobacterium sp.]
MYAEMAERSGAMTTHMQDAYAVLKRMQSEVTIEPLHPQASAGQRLFFFKRVAKEITPYAEEFEREAKQSEEAARLLNKTIFNLVDLLSDPQMRQRTDFDENVVSVRCPPRFRRNSERSTQ